MRISKSGVGIKEISTIAVLLVKTMIPNKYLLIDRETGQMYQGKNPGEGDNNYSWKYIRNLTRKDISKLENNRLDIENNI